MSTLINMHGRQVILTPLPEEVTQKSEVFCHDCGGTASALVSEINRLSKSWNPTLPTEPVYSWFWCQNCDIGG